jgi:hypothetical protein
MEFHAHKAGPLGTKLLLASNRSGKTVCGVVDDIIQLVDESFSPSTSNRSRSGTAGVDLGRRPEERKPLQQHDPPLSQVPPQAALIEGKWGKSFKSQPNPSLVLAGGSEVAFKTYDQDLDAWAGAEVHRIHWDEEPNGANADDLRTRPATGCLHGRRRDHHDDPRPRCLLLGQRSGLGKERRPRTSSR